MIYLKNLTYIFLFSVINLYSQKNEEKVKDYISANTYKLENGLTVILSKNTNKTRCFTAIAVKTGSKNDPSENTGLAHYLEHLLFKGTDKFGTSDYSEEKKYIEIIENLYEEYIQIADPVKRKLKYKEIDSISVIASNYSIANEYDKMMTQIGALNTNAFTSFDQTVYINDIPSNAIFTWLDIEAERFRNPVFRLFHTELEAVYEEKNISIDNEFNTMYEELYRNLFKNHTYGTQTTIGKIEHLKNPSIKKIRQYYDTYYVPNNMAIVIAGDFNESEILEKIKQSFSYLKPKEIPSYSFKPEQDKNEDEEITLNGLEENQIIIGIRLPKADLKTKAYIDVISKILSNGKAGLIDQNVVQKNKVIDAYLYEEYLNDYTVLEISITPNSNSLKETATFVLSQIDSLILGKFDERLIKGVIDNMDMENMKMAEDNMSIALELTQNFILGFDRNDYTTYFNHLSNISKNDICQFANKYLKKNRVIVYKQNGKIDEKPKVEKPAITSVNLNKEKKSEFVSDIFSRKHTPVKPSFIDFDKDIKKQKINDNVELLYTPNLKNKQFDLLYIYDFGYNENKLFALATEFVRFCGNTKFNNKDFNVQMYLNALNFSINTSENRVFIYLNGKIEKFKDGIDLIESLLNNPSADDKTYNEFIKNKIYESKNRKLNKYEIFNGLSNYAKYGKNNPFKNQLTPSELKKIRKDDILSLIKQLKLYPHTIGVVSPLNTSISTIQKTVSPFYQNVTYKVKPTNIIYTPINNSGKIFFTHFDMVQTEIKWQRNSSIYSTEGNTDITLFSEYFGGSMSSILFQTIRESKALAYSTSGYITKSAYKNQPTSINFYIGTQADKLNDAIIALNELINEFPESKTSFDGAVESIRNSIENSKIEKSQLLLTYLNNKRLGINNDLRQITYSGLDKVDLHSLRQFYENEVKGASKYSLSIVGSKKRVDFKKLKQYGTIEKVSIKDIFGY